MKNSLSAERLRELLHYDPETGLFTRRARPLQRVGSMTGGTKQYRYLRVRVDGRDYLAHRLAWLYVTGEWPAGVIDHINGVRTDNRFLNLRDVTQRINLQNLRAARTNNQSSGLLGAHWCEYHKKWKAQIGINGRRKFLAYCATKEEAHSIYLRAKRQLHEGCTI